MEKMTFAYTLSEEQKEKKRANVELLLKHEFVKAWRKVYGVDESFIYDHSGKFMDWIEIKEKCTNCHGLDVCRQYNQGEVLELTYDGILTNRIVFCPYKIKQMQDKLHRKQYQEMDILEEYLLVDIVNLDMSKEHKEYKVAYAKVVKLIKNKTPEKGLYLWGKPGAGKTYLAAGICNYYAKQKKRIAFVNVPKLISDLKMMFQDASSMEQRLRRIKYADVVVLDDIGGESVTSWSRDDILLPLLDARMEKKRLTLFTSNYTLEELEERLSMTANKRSEPVAAMRLLERIQALSCEIYIKGETRRK